MRKASFTLILVSMIGSACEKEQTGQQPGPNLPVVEGIIEENGYPMVVLTRNQAYFSGNTAPADDETWIRDAVVSVSNGPQTQQLREYQLTDAAGRRFRAYTLDTARLRDAFHGETGKSYTLTIESEGRKLTAITTIPARSLLLDSAWWAPGKAGIMARLTGSTSQQAYARYFTARRGEDFRPGMYPLSSRTGTFDLQLPEGPGTYLADYGKGDTVLLKFCNVDHRTYDFWFSAGKALAEGKDPLGPGARATGNVSGALGYWGGYSVTFERIIIPE
ncbi:DUF4249 family protein [Chitinophaga pollutisoli]|uniref:DUF4249 family protein n=1 Tax=Chitinophaga pollutisoli TaxID=3133966 RepID=A0ABZ2YLC2_9BACT